MIDQAREVVQFLVLKAWRGKKVVIIDDAHRMNAQAANALLKSIEEPAEGSYFFLTAPASSHLLSTIRSRCQIVRLRQQKRAMDPDEQEYFQLAHRLLADIFETPQGYLSPDHREPLKDKSTMYKVAQHIQYLLHDAFLLKAGRPEKASNKLYEKLASLDSEHLYKIFQLSRDMQAVTVTNFDPLLLLEEFWIKIRV